MSFKYRRALILTDNRHLFGRIHAILEAKRLNGVSFAFACSHVDLPGVDPIDVKDRVADLIEDYDIIISLHCKQLFPAELVRAVKCINVHPGFNPYNRGWYPQVFSMINKLPVGATIHEMDEQLDHGPIIVQEQIRVFSHDTSKTVYDRILELETRLFSENIERILKGGYTVFAPASEGNVNLKKDFERLKRIDCDRTYTGREMIDLLRALTHSDYRNAYFEDKNNRKIFVKIMLEPEDETI